MAADDSFRLPGPMCLKATLMILAIILRQASLLYRTCFVHVPSSTLSSAVSQQQRRDTVQLNLAFLEIPSPSAIVWETLDEAQRAAALDVLAKLIAQTAQLELSVEGNDDE